MSFLAQYYIDNGQLHFNATGVFNINMFFSYMHKDQQEM